MAFRNLNQTILLKYFQSWELYMLIVSIYLGSLPAREGSSSGIALCTFLLLLRRNIFDTRNLQGAQPKDWGQFDS